MARRGPRPEYYEEDGYELDREQYARPRRSERYDEMEYRHRRVSPPIEEMGRMRIQERAPREYVRETLIVPPRTQPVRMRRSHEEVLPQPYVEDEYYHTRPRRRSYLVRDRETDDEEVVMSGRSRRSLRRRRASPRLDEDEEMALRRRGEVPPIEYESEAERRPRERRFSDIQDEVIVRASDPRRKPRRLEEESEADLADSTDERPRRPKYRTNPYDPDSLTKEEELKVRSRVMEWKDRPTAKELAEEQEARMAHDLRPANRRSPSRTRYERSLPGAWPEGPDHEHYDTDARPRSRKPSADEVQVEEMESSRENYGRGRRRRSTEIEEVIIRKDRRRGSLQERDPSPVSVRAPTVLKEFIPPRLRHGDEGFDNGRPPRPPGSEKGSIRGSLAAIDTYNQTQRGRRSDENITYRRQENDPNSPISPHSFRSGDFTGKFRNPWKTDERRSRLQSLARETETESLAAESTHSRSRRSRRREIIEEDEIDRRETRSKPRSVVSDVKRDRMDDWSVVHVPAKEEPLRMPGSLDFVEMVPKAAPVKESIKESKVAEVEIEEKGRAMPERRKGRERWTEISKELVVRDAIQRFGYEFEEMTSDFYIFSYMEPEDIDDLIELSDKIRSARRQRIREMHRERAAMPRSASLVDRRVSRAPWAGERRVREREWVIDSHH